MTTRRPSDDLDALFSDAQPSAPSDDLVARVLADAAEVQAGFAARPALVSSTSEGLFATLGGWLGMGGLAAACAAGLAVGIVVPNELDVVTDGQISEWLGAETTAFVSFEAVALGAGQ